VAVLAVTTATSLAASRREEATNSAEEERQRTAVPGVRQEAREDREEPADV
jgi:hypothetical protein